jgi:hypothetical protein
MTGKTGIEKDDLPESPSPSPFYFRHDPIEGKGPKPWKLLVIVAVSASMNAPPNGFEPKDPVNLIVQGTREIGRGPVGQRIRA